MVNDNTPLAEELVWIQKKKQESNPSKWQKD